MISPINRQWIFDHNPPGALTPNVFQWRETTTPVAGDGEVLVRTLMLSLDPANRMWMRRPTYREQILPGDVMHGFTIGEVITSHSTEFVAGDVVEGMNGWQDYAVVSPASLTKKDNTVKLEHQIGAFSITGLTAYYGLLEVGRPKKGETVVISAAAGAVGSIAGQIARIQGCRTVGIAGGTHKCEWLINTLGFDAAVDYKSGSFRDALNAACPRGIDLYFDNVGGHVLDAALRLMNLKGRIVCCGAVAGYDKGTPFVSPLLPGVLVAKRLRMEGFIVMDFFESRPIAEEQIKVWIANEDLHPVTEIVDGLEHAPEALIRLLDGQNLGKMAIRL